MGFGFLEEAKGVGFKRESISLIDLVKVAYNSIIMLMGI